MRVYIYLGKELIFIYIIALSISHVLQGLSIPLRERWNFFLSRLGKLIGNKGDNHGVTSKMWSF